jgi:3-hydroxyphenylacetate 6-hydroxylase
MHGLVTWVSFLHFPVCGTPEANFPVDEAVWESPEEFRPERWLEQPEAPIFTYGMGYRMCAGSLLANRELYLVFIRLINCFKIEKADDVDCHPLTGNMDPTTLVAMSHRYKARFVPRNEESLSKAIKDFVVTE